MHAKLIILVSSFVFLTITSVKGQMDCNTNLILKIDSLSNVKHIENGIIKFHRVTSMGESTTTDAFSLARKQKFSFDGPFLVMGNNYFNLNKLLFFFVKEDYIEFYFQGY